MPRFPLYTTRIAATLAFSIGVAGCTAAAPDSIESSPAPLAVVTLATDGLGDILLGFPPSAVIAELSALYGEPDLDSGWVPSEPNTYGSCPGKQMRAVGWGSLVTIFINDGDDPLGERFYTYTYGYDYVENQGGIDPRALSLATPDGISIGSTVADLEAAYAASLRIDGDTALDIWSFHITDTPLRGLVTGPTAADTVTLIELSPGCA